MFADDFPIVIQLPAQFCKRLALQWFFFLAAGMTVLISEFCLHSSLHDVVSKSSVRHENFPPGTAASNGAKPAQLIRPDFAVSFWFNHHAETVRQLFVFRGFKHLLRDLVALA